MLYDKFKPIVLPLHEAKQKGAIQDARSQWDAGNQMVLMLKDEKFKFFRKKEEERGRRRGSRGSGESESE
jgi:hypothetical protein